MITKNTIEVKVPEPFNGLDEESANSYFKAKNNSKLLKDLVITPFQELLKSNTGYSKENLPQKTERGLVELGDHTFTIISERKAKRPQLKTIYNNLTGHIDFLLKHYDTASAYISNVLPLERRPEGLYKINGKPYVTVNAVLDKIQELKDTVFLEELKQTIKHEGKNNEDHKLFLPLYQEMLLNESSANLYVHSDSLIKKMAEIIKPFEGTLNAQTDYNKDNIPDEMKKRIVPVGKSHLFEVTVIPELTVKYAGIFNALTKETEKLTKSTGELIRLRDGFDLEERLSDLYKPVSSNLHMKKEVKISLPGLIKRFGELKEDYTNPSLNIRRKHYPLV